MEDFKPISIEKQEVIKVLAETHGVTSISRKVGVSKKTVKKYIKK